MGRFITGDVVIEENKICLEHKTAGRDPGISFFTKGKKRLLKHLKHFLKRLYKYIKTDKMNNIGFTELEKGEGKL